jgi:hypothetical protein
VTAAELAEILAAAAAVLTAAAALLHSIQTGKRVQTTQKLDAKQPTEEDTTSSDPTRLDPPAPVLKAMEKRGLRETDPWPRSWRWPGAR